MVHQGTLDSTVNGPDTPSQAPRTRSTNATMDFRERTARDFFAAKNLLPSSDQSIKKADIYQAILGATKWPKRDQDQLVKAIEYMVTLLRKADEEESQGELIDAITTNITTAVANNNHPNDIEDRLAQFRNDLTKEIGDMMEKLQKKADDKLEVIMGAPQNRTYAQAAAPSSQIPVLPTLPPAMNKERMKAHVEVKKRQILLLNDGGEKGKVWATKSDSEALKMLNAILEKIEGNEGKKFIAVSKLRNTNHLLTEMNAPEATTWLRSMGTSLQFTLELDDAFKIASKDNEVIIHFVPIAFNPNDIFELRKLEEENELPTCCISKAKWAKAVHNRKENQKVASLLLYLSEPKAANKLISSGAVIANKRVQVSKTIKEEMRCFHCQEFGHIAVKCQRLIDDPDDSPTCGKCTERHPTKDCTATVLHCANCNSPGHASNDRNCPTFLKRCDTLNKRALTNLLPFFPTDEDWTWLDEPSNAPKWRPAPRVNARNMRSAPRQTQVTEWVSRNARSSNQTPLGEVQRWGSQPSDLNPYLNPLEDDDLREGFDSTQPTFNQ